MKIAMNKNTSLRIFNRAPINFWESEDLEEDSTTKGKDTICHEVKYDPTDKGSDTYKKDMKPFSHGMPKQWLKFMEALNVVICGNGLDENGRAHIKCLCAIMEHIFPKDNLLLKQKTYMHNYMFLHLNDKQVSKFHARWVKINYWLNEFPPFQPN